MARKPNYRFERMERDRLKAAKKAERAKAKQEKAEQRRSDTDGLEAPLDETGVSLEPDPGDTRSED